MDIAGAEFEDDTFDGRSFHQQLNGNRKPHRKFVFGVHNNIPEGPAYPIRSINNGEYHYIRNLMPNEIYIEKHLMGLAGNATLNNPYWATWLREAWNNPHTYRLVKRYMHRPAEELYRIADDPFEMTNLADSSAHAEVKRTLSSALDAWLISQGDPGHKQDTHEAIQAARRGEHLYGPTN